jgi:diadenosine tetraphosphate (Ap4A) HIT family hydrolase
MNTTCPFCNTTHARANLIYSYSHWNLFVQSEEKRRETKQAAGFLASIRHIEQPTDLTSEEWVELKNSIKDASKRLCDEVGTTYTNQETVGFNQGYEAGQTVAHAHIHILPVAREDPEELKVRGGIGGAFEALREARLRK